MKPLDHLQQFALIFQRALADLPADKRAIYADLATPHGDALAKALQSAPPAEAGTGESRTQEHG